MSLLRLAFFDTDHLLLHTLDKLLAASESLLETIFRLSVSADYDEDQTFEILDSTPSEFTHADRVVQFLNNIRSMVSLLANFLNNQIKIIVKQRVIYSKELFNYEKYMSLGMHDDRLVRSAVFCKSGKAIVGEYFKF